MNNRREGATTLAREVQRRLADAEANDPAPAADAVPAPQPAPATAATNALRVTNDGRLLEPGQEVPRDENGQLIPGSMIPNVPIRVEGRGKNILFVGKLVAFERRPRDRRDGLRCDKSSSLEEPCLTSDEVLRIVVELRDAVRASCSRVLRHPLQVRAAAADVEFRLRRQLHTLRFADAESVRRWLASTTAHVVREYLRRDSPIVTGSRRVSLDQEGGQGQCEEPAVARLSYATLPVGFGEPALGWTPEEAILEVEFERLAPERIHWIRMALERVSAGDIATIGDEVARIEAGLSSIGKGRVRVHRARKTAKKALRNIGFVSARRLPEEYGG